MPFIDTEKDNVLSFYGDKINLETKGKIQMIKANSIKKLSYKQDMIT